MSTLKEIWKNQKIKGIILLAFWCLFIGSIIVSFSGKTTTTVKEDNFYHSYEFTYSFNNDVYYGVYYNEKYLLYFNNEKFYKNESLYRLKDNSIIKEPFVLKIDSEFIDSVTKDITPISNDTYVVSIKNFMKTLNENTDLTGNITINKYKNKVVIDLAPYYGDNQGNYILTIDYYNINKINDFTKEYDLMIGVK